VWTNEWASEVIQTLAQLWNNSHHPKDVEKELDLSLKQLGLDYIDLYRSCCRSSITAYVDILNKRLSFLFVVMHWPVALTTLRGPEIDTSVTVAETWAAMHSLLKTGKVCSRYPIWKQYSRLLNTNDLMQVRNIGVSNFTVDHLKTLIATTGIKPAVNQVELHPFLHQDDLLEYCKREGIHVTAYLPIGGQGESSGLQVIWRHCIMALTVFSGEFRILATKRRPSLLNHPAAKEVAKNYPEATPAQILLNWGLARGYSVIPKSVTAGEQSRSALSILDPLSHGVDRPLNLVQNVSSLISESFSLSPKTLIRSPISAKIIKRGRINSHDMSSAALPLHRFGVPATSLGWKIDVFGTPEEKTLPTKVLVSCVYSSNYEITTLMTSRVRHQAKL
jgi:diketogulonate reductase-like aldo/keto reductase